MSGFSLYGVEVCRAVSRGKESDIFQYVDQFLTPSLQAAKSHTRQPIVKHPDFYYDVTTNDVLDLPLFATIGFTGRYCNWTI